MSKKSQITIFILLGIVILSVFLFLLFLTNTFGKSKFEKEIDKLVLDIVKTNALDYYVDLCLKKVTSKGLKLLAQQGGVLYTHQNGTVMQEKVPYIRYELGNLIFGIHQSSFLGRIPPRQEYPPPWQYPRPYEYLMFNPLKAVLPPLGYGVLQGYFWGNKTFPYLCEPDGPNDVPPTVTVPSPCKGYQYGPNSVQEQLQHFIQKELEGCMDFEFLKKYANYQIEARQPNVSVTLGEANLFVNATYPLQIHIGSFKTIRRVEFQSFLPVRLKKVYTMVDRLLGLDVGYLNLSVEEWVLKVPEYDPAMRVERFCWTQNCFGVDILKITDTASKLEGKPLDFYTAIENRNPALDYLHRASYPGRQDVDIIVNVKDGVVRLDPQAYDPDDDRRHNIRGDNLEISFEGWKETYDEQFVFEKCKHDFVNAKKQLFRPCIVTPLSRPEPPIWSSRWNGQFAEYAVTQDDIGLHTVRITVKDDQGLKDWQDVGIFVMPDEFAQYGCEIQCITPDNCEIICSCKSSQGDARCEGASLDQVIGAGICNAPNYCNELCQVVGPDSDQQACICAQKLWGLPGNAGGGMCCGDDAEEYQVQNVDAGGKACCTDQYACYFSGNCHSRGEASGKDICGPDGEVKSCSPANDCELFEGYWCDASMNSWTQIRPVRCA